MTSSLACQSERLDRWISDEALPFWARTAIDYRGGWYEDLDLGGSPNADKIRRMRVQARQIYVYALADKMGWYPGKPIVRNTFNFMCDYGLEPHGDPGFIHLLSPDYETENPLRDFYDHAFYLLGCGWAYHATGDLAPLETGENVLRFIDTALSSPEGGWRENPAGDTPRRQNPHMHFLEACMAWHDITDDPKWMDYAARIYTLFQKHFFDPEHHIIREFFDDDWTVAEGEKGETAEPGHAAEWIWLLLLYQKRSGVDTSDYAKKLYTKLLQAGEGFQNDEEDVHGNPRRTTKRLWVQTELIKAHLAQAERGVDGAAERAAKTTDQFIEKYLRGDGTWCDRLNWAAKPDAKTIPTSTLYHIACMVYEAGRVSKLG